METKLKGKYSFLILLGLFFFTFCSSMNKIDYSAADKWQKLDSNQNLQLRVVHLLNYYTDEDLEELETHIPTLAEMGINTVILEVDYHFTFESHPELRQSDNTITKKGAEKITSICSKNGINIIPLFQCLGHQSWAEETYKLLEVYPELDLTPNAFPNNEGLYCREWDVKNPKVYEIVFPLMDEIIDAFDANAMHVGMDEVFLLGSENSPSTKGENPAELYAGCVNEIYNHLVKEKGVEMLMWGDRLINAAEINYGEWEASANGTAAAIDMIPNDIIICDWHYESFNDYKLETNEYLSIPMFLEKGFRVIPTSYKSVENMQNLMYYSLLQDDPNMLGHLFTLWSSGKGDKLVTYPPMVEGLKIVRTYLE